MNNVQHNYSTRKHHIVLKFPVALCIIRRDKEPRSVNSVYGLDLHRNGEVKVLKLEHIIVGVTNF
jgi:hypothetical protein